MRGYGESDKPTGVENYVIDTLDNDLKVIKSQIHFLKSQSFLPICKFIEKKFIA